MAAVELADEQVGRPASAANEERRVAGAGGAATGALVTLIAIGVAGTAWRWRAPSQPASLIEFTFGAPPGYALILARRLDTDKENSHRWPQWLPQRRVRQRRWSGAVPAISRGRVRVSVEGGFNPVWGPDGRELFFLNRRNEIMRAAIDGMTVTARPQMLFQPCVSIDRTFAAALAEVVYDVAPDGTRFLASCSSPDVVPAAITTVVNWQAKLK